MRQPGRRGLRIETDHDLRARRTDQTALLLGGDTYSSKE